MSERAYGTIVALIIVGALGFFTGAALTSPDIPEAGPAPAVTVTKITTETRTVTPSPEIITETSPPEVYLPQECFRIASRALDLADAADDVNRRMPTGAEIAAGETDPSYEFYELRQLRKQAQALRRPAWACLNN